MTQEQILPLSLQTFEINLNLLNAPKTLQDLATQYQNKKNNLNKKDQELGPRRKVKIQIIPKQFSS